MIALYIRLSEADRDLGDGKDESNSVANQRQILWDFVKEHPEFNGQDIEEFVDDGYTGLNFNRPSFLRMKELIREKKIDTVIVKDLSRLGRDYVEVGDYIERFFPFMGVRFLAVNDGYDSDFQELGDNHDIELIMKNIINTYYSMDLSQKITSSVWSRRERGDFVYSGRPYGYLIDPENQGNIVVDPEAGKVVRKIFDLALDGKKTAEIAKLLNEDGIPTIREYNKAKDIKGKAGNWEELGYKYWTAADICRILKNDVYTGLYRSAKSRRLVVGQNKFRKPSDDEIILIENHHEAIVSREEWEQAQLVIQNLATAKNEQKRYPLKSFVICGNCGRTMTYNERKTMDCYFTCQHKSKIQMETGCFDGRVEEGQLNRLVFEQLKKWFKVLHTVDDQVKKLEQERFNKIQENGKQIASLQQELKKIQTKKVHLYESYSDGNLEKEKFTKERDILAGEIKDIKAKLDALHKTDSELRKKRGKSALEFEQLMRQVDIFENEPILTRTMTEIFLKRVIVYDDKHIEIIWNFKAAFENTLGSINVDK